MAKGTTGLMNALMIRWAADPYDHSEDAVTSYGRKRLRELAQAREEIRKRGFAFERERRRRKAAK